MATGGLAEETRDGPARQPGVVHGQHLLAVDAVAYAVVNLLLVAGWIVTEATFFWPVFPLFGCQESFQTVSAVKRALSRAGFRHVTVDRVRPFVVSARR